MKKILLSSAAIVAFAGAASAEITWSGSATLGYNDDFEDGIYVDADIDLSASTELNNGWTASITYGFELDEIENGDEDGTGEADDKDGFNADDNLTLKIYNDTFALTYGDTEYAAVSYWDGVSDMKADGFSEQDGEQVLKFEATYGDYGVAVSGILDADNQELGQGSVGASATFGAITAGISYQEEWTGYSTGTVDAGDDYNDNEILAFFVGGSFAGADVKFAYAKEDIATGGENESIGIEGAYPVGPVTLGAFYVSEDVYGSSEDQTYGISALYEDGPLTAKVYYKQILGNDEYGIGATYDLGMGLTVSGGYIDGDNDGDDDLATYVAAEYDLGGGASFLASYADANSTAAEDTDDIDTVTGGYELLSGTSLLLKLKF
jgi:hypothetical protein